MLLRSLFLVLLLVLPVQAQDTRPSRSHIVSWGLEKGTGHLIAEFTDIAYRYNVEKIGKGSECIREYDRTYLRWVQEGFCWFTLREPEWVMWKNQKQWTWLSNRTGGKFE